jgi:ribosomal protein S18 acetylase RimI-like enzyme
MKVRLLERTEEVLAASALFDEPARHAEAERFVAMPDHFIFVADVDGSAVGFVSGVEMIHPDKGAEMFLYELGVDERFRGQGIATALVAALRDLARERGCYAMWVLTEPDNAAAVNTYRRAGAGEPSAPLLLEWDLTT